MIRTNEGSRAGKEWGQSECVRPQLHIIPRDASAFFHAKRDCASYGCVGGFTYELYTSADTKKPVHITMSWMVPWGAGSLSSFRIVLGQDLDGELDTCMKYSNSDGEEHIGEGIKGLVFLNTKSDQTSSTAAVVFSVLGDGLSQKKGTRHGIVKQEGF